MATSIPWKWMRGQKLTVKMPATAVAFTDTGSPCELDTGALKEATNEAAVFGVAINEPGASEEVIVIVSNDIFRVKAVAGQDLTPGDIVELETTGEVTVLASGKPVGCVVDYDPDTAGYVHIQASFNHLVAYTLLAANTVDSAMYVDASIDEEHLADNSLDSDSYVDGSVDPIHLAATNTEHMAWVHYAGVADITATLAEFVIAVPAHAGVISAAGMILEEAGDDGTDALTLTLDVQIGGVTIFTTAPVIDGGNAACDGTVDTFNAGTGITVGVIDATANDYAALDLIEVTATLVHTTPETEMSGLTIYIETDAKVGA